MNNPYNQSQQFPRETLPGDTLIKTKVHLIEPRITYTCALTPPPHTHEQRHTHTNTPARADLLLSSKSG